ncbi:MAG: hypothetical protein DWQ47_12345 [Acidobacteria bacterium]|nr:MAG: hypothetical protein DWQ32_14760 [Acidobacteriota bacterium]REJ98358.1 MAG: hypothetical protein DWQ38_17560 [Acidobacteriota bacterium]REK17102.1 MAG: hypothetical protein DWQ43_02605 [Acidobacteriota bacterium]REK43012.1 MAG: hypothetical protein DWQ47_12345 [Acidobacteriota bacterium]
MVTCPGANAVLASFRTDRARHIVEEVGVSVRKHMSSVIAVAGHFDCAGNPVSYEEHKEQILRCADRIRNWDFGVRVVGIYVNEWFSIDVVCDSQEDFPQIKSWL